jgi:hypothetical protein
MKLPYSEGTWFALPLRDTGFAVGVVARARKAGKITICYLFGPRRESVPTLTEVEGLKPVDAIRVLQVGDLSLINGEWPIIGQAASWTRSEWPMPDFVRKDPLSQRAWRVQYSDKDPGKVEREVPEPFESTLEKDALFGAGAVELVLTSELK